VADRDPADLLRENAYLKLRNAQLQSDILDLSAEVERLRQIQDRLHGRMADQKPDSPAGGR
jgi:predicted  nucleic acid-binding Zn-ribbon protein